MPNRVRESVNRVLDDAPLTHVTIHDDELVALAGRLSDAGFSLPDWRAPVMLDDREYGPETVADFFLVGNTLNFVFDDLTSTETFQTTYDGATYSGAFAMWASLKRAVEDGIDVTDGQVLASLTPTQTRRIFRGDPPIPLLERRREVLVHVGERLTALTDGHFHSVVSPDTTHRLYDGGDGLVEWLTAEFPEAYRDRRRYRGETVYFDKKAQLAAGMLYGRFADTSAYPIADIEQMTIFADYLIPALLRAEGVFAYSSELAAAVDNGDHIPEGDPMEVELRIATIAAGERLLAELNRHRDDQLTAFHLDQALWRTGRDRDLTHHFTETITY
jgi:hypothetical protein